MKLEQLSRHILLNELLRKRIMQMEECSKGMRSTKAAILIIGMESYEGNVKCNRHFEALY